MAQLAKKQKVMIDEEVLAMIKAAEAEEEEDEFDAKKRQKKEKKEKQAKKDQAQNQEQPESILAAEVSALPVVSPVEGAEAHKPTKGAAKVTLGRVNAGRMKLIEGSSSEAAILGIEEGQVSFGDVDVLKNVSFTVGPGDRLGIVGINGAGKSTLLRALLGEQELSGGRVIKSAATRTVSILRQEFADDLVMNRTLKHELRASFPEAHEVLCAIDSCESAISEMKSQGNKAEVDRLSTHLVNLIERSTELRTFELDSRIDQVFTMLGFSPGDEDRMVEYFSGGWKMRIGLAKVFLQRPDILLLDEPTNHMDLDSVAWLESLLRNISMPMILVSHDREFLDQVCNKIVEIEEGQSVVYRGNYSKFLAERAQRLEVWRDKYQKQVNYVDSEERWIRLSRGDPSLSQAVSSRQAALDRLRKSPQWILPPPKDKKFRFRFPVIPRSGALVVEGRQLTHGYGDGKYETLFKDVSFEIERGLRVGFVGPNGAGKSTMLRLIMGMEDPRKGFVEYGSSNIIASYYAQNQADSLNLEDTVLSVIQHAAREDLTQTEMRALLGQFMFKGDDVHKSIRALSGGEKARVALCRMMLKPANLLILDEPTNHLDISSKEVLEDALLNFPGSVVLVSHDRYFMSQVVNTIFEFHDQTITRYDCDYREYISTHKQSLDRVESRYVEGDTKYQISSAKPIQVELISDQSPQSDRKKNFGGSGVTCGNLNKGIKNAKRFGPR